ncbi:ATP-dependent DNA helicase [Algiphilus sp. W345]|uniref:ATP-dependent DNA helicase n=1 Tax=Banduia mediterranea TaxID=3075609 RepID=A0ABU2WL83_9GAMM|nr:ATP-dependent DNA helicase [Algiphilus sp. W345]MDT0498313.1 ATP-dependent DNA helicase [Algiphilus sp. W345]
MNGRDAVPLEQRAVQAFAEAGALAAAIEGFSARPAQVAMAGAVARTLDRGGTLVVEAGTGTGKTFAYLVPALLAGRRVVISTGTKNLQDQLFHRDLPRVAEALGVPVRRALLKGRGNYACIYRSKRALNDARNGAEIERLMRVRQWLSATSSGEIAELGFGDEADPLVPRITSTVENCLGARCPDFERCHVVHARRNAASADVVVVNHHLLFADFVLKQEGFGQILPGADAVIVDEAHQVPELALRFFGSRLSTRQLLDLSRDTARELSELGDVPDAADATAAVTDAAVALERVFLNVSARTTAAAYRRVGGAGEALVQVEEALAQLFVALDLIADRAQGVAAARDRTADAQRRLAEFLDQRENDSVRWVEPLNNGGALHTTPIRVESRYATAVSAQATSWVYTSATLAAGGDFSHFTGTLGLDDAEKVQLESPFDYARQSRMWLPQGLPDPNDPTFTDAFVDTLLPLLEASQGGAFVLCTSHRALKRVAQRLQRETCFPLFVQGENDRATLLEGFSESGRAVLVGAASFWEGVDVRGSALRLVAIDRLPFAAPGDPVFDARINALRQSGGQPFMQLQLPAAIVALRQGSGRLIRDQTDLGLLVLGDPRLRTRGYGRTVLDSLPPMTRVNSSQEAQDWLRTLAP